MTMVLCCSMKNCQRCLYVLGEKQAVTLVLDVALCYLANCSSCRQPLCVTHLLHVVFPGLCLQCSVS